MQETTLVLLLSVPVLFVSLAGTGLVRRLALAGSLLDLPVERSSHKIPTPTAGGIALVCAFYLGLLLQQQFFQPLSGRETGALLCGLALALIGLLDDLHQLDFRWRIAVHLAAASAVVLLLGNMPALTIGPLQLGGPALAFLLILSLAWVTNLYNFMDGTDGLAASECCFIALAASLLLAGSGDSALAGLTLLLFAASAGFLFWNWAPARIFMGDTGSGFLGFTLGTLALLSYAQGSMQLWSWLLLAGVFVADASTTVLRRMLTGERWYQAHCTHAYQHAAKRWGHRNLALAVLVINVCWLLPLSWFAEIHPEYGVYLALFGIVPLLVLSDRLGAGRPLREDQLQELKD